MSPIKVKGKEAPLRIFAILGEKNDSTAPASVKELRARLGTEGDVSDDLDEVKYEILQQ